MKLSLIILCVAICYVSSLSDPLPLRNAFNAAISVWKSEGKDAIFNEGEWSANSLCPATSTPYWPPLSGQLADVLQNGTVRLCTPAGQSTNLDGSPFQNCTLGATCTGRLADTNQYLWSKVASRYGFSVVIKYMVPATSQECFDSLYAGTTDALTLNYGTSVWRDPSGVTRPRDSAFHPHCPTGCSPSRIQTRNDTNITTLDKARAFGNANPTKILVSGTGAVAEAAAFFNLSSTVLVSSNDDSVVIDALFVKKTVDIVYPAFEATSPVVLPYKAQSFVIAQSVTDSCTVGFFRLREYQAPSASCYAISFNNNP